MSTPPGQALRARLLLALLVGLGLAWLATLDYSRKITVDVLDLLPAGEQSPELAMVRSFASERQGRVVLLSVQLPAGVEAGHGEQVCTKLADQLRGDPAFEEVQLMSSGAWRRDVARRVFERRLDLLFPQWLDRQLQQRAAGAAANPAGEPLPHWLAERAAAELDAFMTGGEVLALSDLLPSDPLLLMGGLVESLGGQDSVEQAAGQAGLLWALQRKNPLSPEGQGPVFGAVARAESLLSSLQPGASLRWTGVARFAAESRSRIEAELSWLNTCSLVAVVLVCLLFVGRLHRAWHLLPPMLLGLLGGWVAVTLCFERVHALVFVVGALLGGVAVDYGVYLFLQPPLSPGEAYASKLARLIRPLLASALTTVLGFSLLFASELPLIRQLGVFVGAGLLSALAGAVLWFAQVRDHNLEARPLAARSLPDTPRLRRLALAGFAAALLLAACSPFLTRWKDDIRELEIPAPELRANDLSLRRLFGEGEGRTLYLTRAQTPSAARDAWSRFAAWHKTRHPEAPLLSIALLLPDSRQWAQVQHLRPELSGFGPVLLEALERRGFDPAGFGPFLESWRAWLAASPATHDALCRSLNQELTGPLSLLVSSADGNSFYGSAASQVPDEEPPSELDTLTTGQLGTLNRVFSQYRSSALWLSCTGLGLLGLSVLVMYGPRRGLQVFSVPLLSCFVSFGLLGLFGHELNLFHLLGAFLGVCLSHNYAIFTTENALRGEGAPPSIRLSALSTAASFGVLAFSRIPVVAALGYSVALIVLTALCLVEGGRLLPWLTEAGPRSAGDRLSGLNPDEGTRKS